MDEVITVQVPANDLRALLEYASISAEKEGQKYDGELGQTIDRLVRCLERAAGTSSEEDAAC